ncbi:hypothetical protein SteCoe_32349 [Stentor coeruleus]|uniref:Uncharacterized protein n=1 Tax=Stentor coeruleus TaxID=5963 RepID=A0A1R2AZ89_9CILI|nr:hypothetical protein SteCoe_32349 [Stentor coeruleus]
MEPNDREIAFSILLSLLSSKEENTEGVSLKKIILDPFFSGLSFGLDNVLKKIPTASLSWGKYCVYSVLNGLTYMA